MKWLRSIRAVDDRSGATRTPAPPRPPDRGGGRDAGLEDPARSLMVPPGMPEFLSRERLVEAGPVRVTGRAWSGWGTIERVEFSDDGGASGRTPSWLRRPVPTPGGPGRSTGTPRRGPTSCAAARRTPRGTSSPSRPPGTSGATRTTPSSASRSTCAAAVRPDTGSANPRPPHHQRVRIALPSTLDVHSTPTSRVWGTTRPEVRPWRLRRRLRSTLPPRRWPRRTGPHPARPASGRRSWPGGCGAPRPTRGCRRSPGSLPGRPSAGPKSTRTPSSSPS